MMEPHEAATGTPEMMLGTGTQLVGSAYEGLDLPILSTEYH